MTKQNKSSIPETQGPGSPLNLAPKINVNGHERILTVSSNQSKAQTQMHMKQTEGVASQSNNQMQKTGSIASSSIAS